MDLEKSEFETRAVGKAIELASWLEKAGTTRVVFAESCTAGLISALLGQVPGISNYLCGSAVTYRESVKESWIGVSPSTIESHTAESLATTREMAIGVLERTGEATVSAAVTGHLGPAAPEKIDGTIFVAVAQRTEAEYQVVFEQQVDLDAKSRIDRQHESAGIVLASMLKCLAGGET